MGIFIVFNIVKKTKSKSDHFPADSGHYDGGGVDSGGGDGGGEWFNFIRQKVSACSLVVNQRQEASRAPYCIQKSLSEVTYTHLTVEHIGDAQDRLSQVYG